MTEGVPAGGMDAIWHQNAIDIVWPEQVDDRLQVRFTRLMPATQTVTSHILDLGAGASRYVRLLPHPVSGYILLWASRLPGTPSWELQAALLDEAGDAQGQPVALVMPEADVTRFDAAVLPSGEVFVLWHQNKPAGVYTARWQPGTSLPLQAAPLAENGVLPTLYLAPDDRILLTWQEGDRIRFGVSDLESTPRLASVAVARLPQGTGMTVSPAVSVLSGDRVYIFWSVLNHSGLEAGSGYIEYVSFPLTAPGGEHVSQRVYISPAESPAYQPADLWPGITLLAPPASPARSSDFILEPAVAAGPDGVLALALTARQAYRLDAYVQVAAAFLQDGALRGYAWVSRSEQLVQEPHVLLDPQGYLHLLWREGAFGQRVFYATNEPQIRTALDTLTAADWIDALLEGSLESLTGILFLPIVGFGWLLPGLVVVGVWKLIRDDENIADWPSLIVLLLALGVYQAVKWISMPPMAAYVPFSAWLDIPAVWQMPLRVVVPLAALGLGAVAAWRTARRRNRSAVLFYLVTGLVDALITLAVYGVIFLGVY